MEVTVNDRIKMLRSALNLSQNEFAQKLGSTIITVSRWETGHTIPKKNLYRINQVFGVSIEWLEHGIGDMQIITPQLTSIKELDLNPWKDALVSQLKDENTFLKDQIQMMREMLQLLKPQANFLNGNALAVLNYPPRQVA